jgi:4-deoxy-L-threo-5-hexosulose-uronate ketol-isomerase
MKMTRPSPTVNEYATLTTPQLREAFLLESLYEPGAINLAHWEVDRAVVGFAVPLGEALELGAMSRITAAEYFCERREAGIINLGGGGSVTTDGQTWKLGSCDTLYVGRGTKAVSMASDDAEHPAVFYLISYPAHAEYPTALATPADANKVELGSRDNANERTIYQQIHKGGIRSCQLVMGYTVMGTGSVWNTFPPHTHERRSEIYNYFDLEGDNLVMHFMGPADASRSLVVRNFQPVLSPPWSMHAGAGTAAYKFVWAMGGENQEFTDMDAIPLSELQ